MPPSIFYGAVALLLIWLHIQDSFPLPRCCSSHASSFSLLFSPVSSPVSHTTPPPVSSFRRLSADSSLLPWLSGWLHYSPWQPWEPGGDRVSLCLSWRAGLQRLWQPWQRDEGIPSPAFWWHDLPSCPVSTLAWLPGSCLLLPTRESPHVSWWQPLILPAKLPHSHLPLLPTGACQPLSVPSYFGGGWCGNFQPGNSACGLYELPALCYSWSPASQTDHRCQVSRITEAMQQPPGSCNSCLYSRAGAILSPQLSVYFLAFGVHVL